MQGILAEDPLMTFVVLVLLPLGILLIVLWIALPFSVFGIKSRLDTIIEQLDAISQQQEHVRRLLRHLAQTYQRSQESPRRRYEEKQDL
jgi:hypothetical protein